MTDLENLVKFNEIVAELSGWIGGDSCSETQAKAAVRHYWSECPYLFKNPSVDAKYLSRLIAELAEFEHGEDPWEWFDPSWWAECIATRPHPWAIDPPLGWTPKVEIRGDNAGLLIVGPDGKEFFGTGVIFPVYRGK